MPWVPVRTTRTRATATPTRQSDAPASWVVTVTLLVAALAQAPGRILPETKLGIALDPVGELARALSAWDPSAGFGRVQNQAIGYLFPMGPWFAAGRLLGVPPWIVQRLWIGALLVTGYWGTVLLARAVGVRTAGGRVTAGLAYTLSAASLGVVAFQSAGQLPYALAPWVLVPLVGASPGVGPRRAAARSGLAILAMGGVNAAATVAVLPLVGIWASTRAPGRDRRRLLLWWCGCAAAATAWWAVALAVSVRYGIRFTQLTEQAATTTGTESAAEIWRGTGNWLSRLSVEGRPWLPGGTLLATAPAAVLATVAAAGAGAIGLLRRDAPGRAWLLPCLLVGVVLIGAGYAGPGGGSLAGTVRHLLDGPLGPLRNVHKFSPLVRLPLALGLGHLVVAAGEHVRSATDERGRRVRARVHRLARTAPAAVAVAVVAVGAFPLLTGSVTAPGSFARIPSWWPDATRYVDAHAHGSRTLVVPGAAFAETTWGRPLDEPIGVLSSGSWAARDLIPLGGNGSTRLLDAVDTALESGVAPPGLASALGRAGVGQVLVRNDLDHDRTGSPDPGTVRRALAGAPGLRLAASFGPRGAARPAIDVYRVSAPVARAVTYPQAGSLLVGGAAEAMVDLPPALVAGRAVEFADSRRSPTGPAPVVVATDSARRRDVDFGRLHDDATRTLEADEPAPAPGRKPKDRWQDDLVPARSVAVLLGARSIDADGGTDDDRPGHQPYAAFDGDPTTSWAPSEPAVGRWIRIELTQPQPISSVVVRLPTAEGRRVRAIVVTTDHGRRRATIDPTGVAVVAVPRGRTTAVRVEIASLVAGVEIEPPGLAEVELHGAPGVEVSRPIRATSPGPASVASFRRIEGEDARLDRSADLLGASDWRAAGTASLRPGPAGIAGIEAARAATTPGAGRATSSSWSGRGDQQPELAVDGDAATAWVSGRTSVPPRLRLDLARPTTVRTLRIVPGPGSPRPTSIEVVRGDQRLRRAVPLSGRISLPALRTDRIELVFDPGRTGARRVAIAEVEVPGARFGPAIDPTVTLPTRCGSGPTVVVGGRAAPTAVDGTIGDLLTGRPVRWQTCGPLAPLVGTTRFTAPGDPDRDPLRVDTLVAWSPSRSGLTGDVASPSGTRGGAEGRSLAIGAWGATRRRLRIGSGGAAVVATTENANRGWRATSDGRPLRAVTVDGWRQGFVGPAGAASTIELRFAPEPLHHGAVALLLVALVGLPAAALAPPRPRRDRPQWSPPHERAWAHSALVALGVLLGVALAGPVVLVFGLLLATRGGRHRDVVVVTASLVVVATLVLGAGRGPLPGPGAYSAAAQAAATVAWLAMAARAVADSSSSTAGPGAITSAAGSTPSTRARSGHRPPRTGSRPGGTG